MKTTNFKPNLYFYHRIPLTKTIFALSQETKKTWSAAATGCASLAPGAHLVEIETPEQQEVLVEILYSQNNWWMAATDLNR